VKRSTVGQTHPVEEVYPACRNIAADAAAGERLSVDNCALLLTSDDWLRSLADTRDRPGTTDYQIDFAASVLIMAKTVSSLGSNGTSFQHRLCNKIPFNIKPFIHFYLG